MKMDRTAPVKVQSRAKTFSRAVKLLTKPLLMISPCPKSTDLAPLVRQLLSETARGRTGLHEYVTAYQLFRRMPPDLRKRLASKLARPGRGAGEYHSGASAIAKACSGIRTELDVDSIDTGDVIFQTRKNSGAVASSRVCTLYRLRRE
jgi:hypothetical protein